ncbi:hypothetical protein ACIP9X_03270 [Arthrobacter sp. NPDC093125]|uniref:hypothetical protein n=1 Tax=Arthrobacter sp. NPDC093125 TaxID=3363944 RepID=UPI0038191E87
MSLTVMNRARSSNGGQRDLPGSGLDDEPTSAAGAAPGNAPDEAPAGTTESLIPRIFPVYAFI